MSDESSQTKQPEAEAPAPEKKPAEKAESPPAAPPKKTPKEKQPKPAAGKPASSHGLLIMGLALLAVIAGGAGYYNFLRWQEQTGVNASLTRDVADQAAALKGLQNQWRETQAALAEEVRQRQTAQAEHEALKTAMQELSAKLGRTTVAWRLAEVENLLTIANQRLALEQDLHTAQVALETADHKLKVLGDPALLPVRQRISSELTALKAVSEPDIPGMALSLGSLAEAVTHLPLVNKTPPAPATKIGEHNKPLPWQEIPKAVWEDLKGLVRVRRHEQPVEPLLPPEEEWYLRQNLRLMLEQARLALLRRDTALFRQSLAETGQWLTAYFDPQAAAVKSMAETLASLSQTALNPSLPDISASLRELRSQMQQKDEAAVAPGKESQGT
jgi:uroporphyrin-3 C-methyltransferase